MPLTLQATLLGKAKTQGEHFQITLKIAQDVLHLSLLPEQAAIFPDLVQQEGGGHPTYDPRRITYNQAPGYTITIEPIETEAPIALEPIDASAEAAAEPELAPEEEVN